MSLTMLEAFSPAPSRQLRAVGVPQTDPPYDDELDAVPLELRLVSSRSAHNLTDGSLALALPLPLSSRPALRLVPTLPRTDARTGRDITPEFLPDPAPRAAQLARAVLEVLAGDRPARHLARVTAADVQDQLEESAGPRASRPWARSLRSVRLSQPGPGIAEVTAVVERGIRCSALAFRMEGLDGRWIVTELALP